jgi:hypothetical protein
LSGQMRILRFLVGGWFIMLSACANMGTITGGEKDELAPEVLRCVPPNGTVLFTKRSIEIVFDEYVELKNLTKQWIISPPMKEVPLATTKKRSVLIEWKEDLLPNATYCFFFGDAIVDLNEGNALKGFRYVFSTGSELDSLRVSGKVMLADKNSAGEDVLVMVYPAETDSPLVRVLPRYVGKTDKSGEFEITGMAAGKYQIFALQDGNANFLYDQPTEMIAFLDSLIEVRVEAKVGLESVDSASMDSVEMEVGRPSLSFFPPPLSFSLFKNRPDFPRVISSDRMEPFTLQLVFNTPQKGFPDILGMDNQAMVVDFQWFSPSRDTLQLWLGDSMQWKQDTLRIQIRHHVIGFQPEAPLIDTLILTNRRQKEMVGRGVLPFTSQPGPGGILEAGRNLQVVCKNPLKNFLSNRFQLLIQKDTAWVPIPFSLKLDSLDERLLFVQAAWEPASNYRLAAHPAALMDGYGQVSDSVQMSFRSVQDGRDGAMVIDFQSDMYPGYLVIMTEKYQDLRRFRLERNGKLRIPNLEPGKYRIRYWVDLLANDLWDSGSLTLKQQPEPMFFHPDVLEIRSNWELEVPWKQPERLFNPR